jgi:hypothetical protein
MSVGIPREVTGSPRGRARGVVADLLDAVLQKK